MGALPRHSPSRYHATTCPARRRGTSGRIAGSKMQRCRAQGHLGRIEAAPNWRRRRDRRSRQNAGHRRAGGRPGRSLRIELFFGGGRPFHFFLLVGRLMTILTVFWSIVLDCLCSPSLNLYIDRFPYFYH